MVLNSIVTLRRTSVIALALCLLFPLLGGDLQASAPQGSSVKIVVNGVYSFQMSSDSVWDRYVGIDRMYRVTGEDLARAGLTLSGLHADSINLYMGGEAQPILIENAKPDGTFGKKTTVKFYGLYPRNPDGSRNIETIDNVYYLIGNDSQPAKRFSIVDANPNRIPSLGEIDTYEKLQHFERDRTMITYELKDMPGFDRTAWHGWIRTGYHWNKVFIPNFFLADLAEGAESIGIEIMLWGNTYLSKNPDHKWDIVYNYNYPLGQAVWDGRVSYVFQSSIPIEAAVTRNHAAEIDLNPAHEDVTIDAIALDWIELKYLANIIPVFDFVECNLKPEDPGIWTVKAGPGFSSDVVDVFNMTNQTYLKANVWSENDKTWGCRFAARLDEASSDFVIIGEDGYYAPESITSYNGNQLSVTNPPDEIIITHPDFVEPLQKLANYRKSQGMSVSVVAVDQIFDHYSNGLLSAESIRLYIMDLLDRPPDEGALKYVLLVGNTTDDYTGIDAYSRGDANWVPSIYALNKTGASVDYAPVYACDDYFAMMAEDKAPRVAVGRVPVSSAKEAEVFVDKIIAFEKSNARADLGEWSADAVLIAAENFGGQANRFAKALGVSEFGDICKIYAESRDYITFVKKDEKISILKKELGLDKDDNVEAILSVDETSEIAAKKKELAKLQEEVDEFRDGNRKMQESIVNAFNDGAGIFYFVGHGSRGMWRTGSAMDAKYQTDMFNDTHIDSLKNYNRYPIVYAATCFSCVFGKSDQPNIHVGIGPQLVLAEDKGAIAAIGQVNKTNTSTPTRFATNMCEYIDQSPDEPVRLGDAYIKAKTSMAGEQARGIALIGDPALDVSYLKTDGKQDSSK